MSRIGPAYRASLRGFGAMHLVAGVAAFCFLSMRGDAIAALVPTIPLLAVAAAFLSRGRVTRFLRFPNGLLAGVLVTVAVFLLGGLGLLAGAVLALRLELSGLHDVAKLALIPGGVVVVLAGLPVILFVAMCETDAERRFGKRTRRKRLEGENALDRLAPASGSVRALNVVDWFVRFLLGGPLALTIGAALHLLLTDPLLHDALLLTGRRITGLYIGCILVGGMIASPIRITGDIVSHPRSIRQALVGRGLFLAPVAFFAVWIAERLVAAGLYPGTAPWLWLVRPAAIGLSVAAVALGVAVSLTGPRLCDLHRTEPSGAAPPAPPAAPDARLPALGPAMALYAGADWLVLRLVGLGLIASGWMIWDLRAAGQGTAVEGLAHGADPLVAVGLHVGLGAILAVPALLPHALSVPRHIGWGAVKAGLLVGAILALTQPIHVAIATYAPAALHAPLLETVPPLFKSIAGISVTATLLVTLFRHLGQPGAEPAPQGVPLDAIDLRALRESRMGRA